MQFDLVFVGLSAQAQSDWSLMSDRLGARAWFFDGVEAVEGLRFADVDVLIAEFTTRAAFHDVRQKYRLKGGGSLSVAIIEEPDFEMGCEAFRAGATDVVEATPSRSRADGLINHLQSVAVKQIHPDAVLPLEVVERIAIRAALLACNGQISKTSRKLGIGLSTLYRKLEQYELLEWS